MTHRTFKEIGSHLANGWGFDDGGDLNAKIKTMTESKEMICLLAAAVDQLEIATQELRALRTLQGFSTPMKPADRKGDPVADGMLRWMAGSLGDKPIEELDTSGLSVRARKALRRSGVSLRSQLTPEILREVKNCGETTIRELMEWAAI